MKHFIKKQASLFLLVLIFCAVTFSGKVWAVNIIQDITVSWDTAKAPATNALTAAEFNELFSTAIGPDKNAGNTYYVVTGTSDDKNGIYFKDSINDFHAYQGKLSADGSYYVRFTLHAKSGNGFDKNYDLNSVKLNNGVFQKNEYNFSVKDANTAYLYLPARVSPCTPPAKPKQGELAVTGTYTYNGKVQTATVKGYDPTTMNIMGIQQTTAGTHQIKVTPKTTWSDNTTSEIKVNWTINKATPTFKTPTGFTGVADALLSSVKLPANFKWENDKTVLAEGTQTYTATYTPSDTTNYVEVKGVKISVTTPLIPNVTGDESLAYVESQIAASKYDGDLAGSQFDQLRAYANKSKKTSFQLNWRSVPGAVKYRVYTGKCGNHKAMTFLTEVTGTTLKRTNRAKGSYFKYLVIAVNQKGRVISKSKTIHVTTLGKKYTNPTGVKVRKSKLTVKVGKTVSIKASLKTKGKVKNHRKLAYESLNPGIATVDKKGKVRGVAAGTCKIVVYAQNGLSKTVTITVK